MTAAPKLKLCRSCERPLPAPPRADEEEGPAPGRAWAFVGMTGTGKSYREKAMVADWLRSKRDVVYFDTHREMSVDGLERKLASRGPLPQSVSASEFLENPASWLRVDAVTGEILPGQLALAIYPDNPDDPAEVGRQFVEVAPKIKGRGNLIFGVTEVMVVAMGCAPAAQLLDLIATGWRKEGVVLVLNAQFLVQIPAGTRAQLTRLYLFRQVKRAHRALVAQETSPEIARRVRRLGVGEFVVFDAWDDPDGDEENEELDGSDDAARPDARAA